MINFNNVSFVKSTPSVKERPQESFPEVLIVGKSNVGKSSLINSLCQRKSLAFTSSKPGHTRLLNYYNIDNKFYLVDAPGYGFARGGVDLDRLFGTMMDEYFTDNPYLKLVLLLIDSRREFGENDTEILNYLIENQIPYFVVITKTDKINQKGRSELNKRLKEMNVLENVYFTSSLSNRTLDKLKTGIEQLIK
ncbi:MAG: YihA family ribosome biogenesis GTP-binding protein [Bacilli bacterium]|nr:YihA family ribosome biogenesis GTP-binding protein [Bacilli bacterium]